MITKKSEIAASAPKFNRRSSIFSSITDKDQPSSLIWIIYVIIFVIILALFVVSVRKSIVSAQSKVAISPYDNKLVVGRFKRSYNIWNTIATDPMFLVLLKTLMDINTKYAANASDGFVDKGYKEINDAYLNLDRYVKQNLKFPENVRITCMYHDGIVIYDSVLPVNNVFFMKDGLPRPVNLYTLGSPLKDHNMLPEVANAIVVTDVSDNYISGYELTDPFYRKLVNEGYGFNERMSSTFSKPFNYMAHLLPLETDAATGFVHCATLRTGMPIEPKEE